MKKFQKLMAKNESLHLHGFFTHSLPSCTEARHFRGETGPPDVTGGGVVIYPFLNEKPRVSEVVSKMFLWF